MCREYVPQIGVAGLFRRGSIGGYKRFTGFLEMPDERSVFVEVMVKDAKSPHRVKLSEKLTDTPSWPVLFDEEITPKANMRFLELQLDMPSAEEGISDEAYRLTLVPRKTSAGDDYLEIRAPKLTSIYN